MESEASWALLALALAAVTALVAVVAWLVVTEARVVRPAPASKRGEVAPAEASASATSPSSEDAPAPEKTDPS